MAKYVNIGMRRHEELRISRTFSAGAAYTVETGEREEEKLTGRFGELQTHMLGLDQEAGQGLQIQCELQRLGGDVGELTVTRSWFKKSSSGATDDDNEEEPVEEELGTEDAPMWSVTSTVVQEPLLCHPKFKGISGDELDALKAVMDGADVNSQMPKSDGTTAKISQIVDSDAGRKALDYLKRGVIVYNVVSTEATARWKGHSNSYTAGEIAGSLPRGINTPSGRNWLCSGTGTEQQGGVRWQSASFRLSGPGGWDEYLYSE